jgi:hypothetical protein
MSDFVVQTIALIHRPFCQWSVGTISGELLVKAVGSSARAGGCMFGNRKPAALLGIGQFSTSRNC